MQHNRMASAQTVLFSLAVTSFLSAQVKERPSSVGEASPPSHTSSAPADRVQKIVDQLFPVGSLNQRGITDSMKIEEVYLGELVKGISEHHVLGVQKLRSNKEKVILFRLDDDGNGGGPALAHGD